MCARVLSIGDLSRFGALTPHEGRFGCRGLRSLRELRPGRSNGRTNGYGYRSGTSVHANTGEPP